MRRTLIALVSAISLTLTVPTVATAQTVAVADSSTGESSSASAGSVADDYLDGLHEMVGSSDSPTVNTALTLLADWALGAVLVSVVGGLLATFL